MTDAIVRVSGTNEYTDFIKIPPFSWMVDVDWSKKHYSGSEKDMTLWLYSQHFWDEVQRIFPSVWKESNPSPVNDSGCMKLLSFISSQSDAVVDQISAIAHYKTMESTNLVEQTSGMAKSFQVLLASKYGWYHLVPAEYETIQELLMSLIDPEGDNYNGYWNSTFQLSNVILPALQKAGIPPENIVSVPQKHSKAVAAVPTLNIILDRNKKEDGSIELDDESLDEINEVLKGIGDDRSVRQFRADLSGISNKSFGSPIKVNQYVVSDGLVLTMKLTEVELRSIKRKLNGMVDIQSPSDIFELMNEVNNYVKKRSNSHKLDIGLDKPQSISS